LNHFFKIVNEAQVDDMPQKAKQLLEELKQHDAYFITRLILTNSKDNLYFNLAILPYIPVNDFMSAYMNLANKRKTYFFQSLKKRYEFTDFIPSLVSEKDWLEKVNIEIKNNADARKHTVTGKILSDAYTDINEFIKKLDNK
jgi:hypothetical protein